VFTELILLFYVLLYIHRKNHFYFFVLVSEILESCAVFLAALALLLSLVQNHWWPK